MKEPGILAIDTSCDETCAAVSYGRKILSNVISSQVNIHAKWGGVVPHLAKRAHLEKIEPVIKKALKQGQKQGQSLTGDARESRVGTAKPEGLSLVDNLVNNINAIAITIGPGLAPALEVGVNYAKKLAKKYNKPLIAINHMEGHLLSPLALPNTLGLKGLSLKGIPDCKSRRARRQTKGQTLMNKSIPFLFPAIGLLVSGGHTQLVLVKKIGDYQLLGETLDDAAGEALDKLAKMLKLGYPGGPIIEQLAKKGNPNSIDLPVPIRYSKNFNFSFSGLKTAALYKIQGQSLTGDPANGRVGTAKPEGLSLLEKQYIHNMSASFQQSIAISLTTKLTRAIKEFKPKSIFLGGGVINNIYIRNKIRSAVRPFKIPVHIPYNPKKLLSDNAAMICIPAYYKFLKKDFVTDINNLDRQPNLNF
ncbi:MAG: tRNA (adenosine(37)-N6)-threonylcarbamoyltransferase complex transferase subunit TsaD [Patescibacteria group bacterium]|nr:tRNA (adenosine(37)-N6)-threonylcarbamoyltransferase complex transferase subunit TsaD [Patescibacteria group bacterium]